MRRKGDNDIWILYLGCGLALALMLAPIVWIVLESIGAAP